MKVVRKQTQAGQQFFIALKKLKDNKKVGKVGWFAGSKYPDGTQVAYVAAIQEFGFPGGGIPARPTMRPTIEQKKDDWKLLAERLAKQLVKNELSVDEVLGGVVQKAAADVRRAISQLVSPALQESTLAARARRRGIKRDKLSGTGGKPLIDRRVLYNTLDGAVTDK